MPEFTGTIDQFMMDNESLINSLIQEKINEKLVQQDHIVIEIENNATLKEKIQEVKGELSILLRQEFQDWEITWDTEAFVEEFKKHFQLSEDEIQKMVMIS